KGMFVSLGRDPCGDRSSVRSWVCSADDLRLMSRGSHSSGRFHRHRRARGVAGEAGVTDGDSVVDPATVPGRGGIGHGGGGGPRRYPPRPGGGNTERPVNAAPVSTGSGPPPRRG